MKMKNFLLKFSKFVLLVGFFSSNIQLLAEDRKNCLEDFPSSGFVLKALDNNQWKLTFTKFKYLEDAPNNKSLAEHIAFLKIDVMEGWVEFIQSDSSSITPTKYGGYKYTKTIDNSWWNAMKISIASINDLDTCIYENSIYVTGEWSSKSVERFARFFDLEETFDELFSLEEEDPKFDIDKLIKKYPTILETEDPKVLRKVINNWRKNRKF